MKKLTLLLGVLSCMLLWLLWPRDGVRDHNGLVPPVQDLEIAARVRTQPEQVESETAVRRTNVGQSEAEGNVSTAPATKETRDSSSLAEIRGRFSLPGGKPAIGLSVQLGRWSINQERRLKYGAPKNWKPPAAQLTQADGSFSLRFDPPHAYQFTLDTTFAGYARESWRWEEIKPGQKIDLGSTQLARSGDVLVTVVNAQGEPISGISWTILGRSTRKNKAPNRTEAAVWSSRSEGEGRYRLRGLPAGLAQVNAQSSMAVGQPYTRVRVVPGRQVEATILYKGPNHSRSIVLAPSTRPLHFVARQLEVVRLMQDGQVIAQLDKPKPNGKYIFEQLGPGFYEVEIEDSRLAPWAQAGLVPGSWVRARLRGNAGLALTVIDAESGNPIEDYQLSVRLEVEMLRVSPQFGTEGIFPELQLLRSAGEEAPPGGLYDGMMPLPQTLIVDAPGYAELELPLMDLAPQETRRIEARLLRTTLVRGRFTDALDGAPIAGVQVYLLPPGSSALSTLEHRNIHYQTGGDTAKWPQLEPADFVFAASTNKQGHFRFESIPSGEYTLLGHADDWSLGKLDPILVQAARSSPVLELVVEGRAGLHGRLLAPADADFAGLHVIARPTAEAVWMLGMSHSKPTAAVDAEGRFEFVGLPAGLTELELAQRRGTSTTHLGITLETAELHPGEVLEYVADLRTSWPSSATITVRQNGQPIRGITVSLRPPGSPRSAPSAKTNAEGVAHIERVAPGEYGLHLNSAKPRWNWSSGQQLDVHSAVVARATLEYNTAKGVLTLLDAENDHPLARVHAMVLSSNGNEDISHRTTDARGSAVFELPVGIYQAQVSADGARWPQLIEFNWTPGGPAPADLRFERPLVEAQGERR